MKQLKENWLTDGLIDFEYKKYILLAYLKYVKDNFNDRKLFPFLSDLVFHYRNLQTIKQKKQLIMEKFPKVISKADFKNLKLTYEKIIEDSSLMEEIESIVSYALINFKNELDHGREIYEFIEENTTIEPIGLTSLYINEGYIFISKAKGSDLLIYQYMITVFENSEETFRGVNTTFVDSRIRSISNTCESIKLELVRKNKELPNPATYLINTKIDVPVQETLLPIAKRILIRYVSGNNV